MEDVLELPEEMIADEEQLRKQTMRQQKYLQRFYKQSMAPGIKFAPGGKKYEVPGKWIGFEDSRPPVYVKDEPHIRRLINEQGGHVIQDPRPGDRSSDMSPVPGITGPAGRPVETPEHIKKIDALEQEIGTLKSGMSQIIALLQANQQSAQPKQESDEVHEPVQSKAKK